MYNSTDISIVILSIIYQNFVELHDSIKVIEYRKIIQLKFFFNLIDAAIDASYRKQHRTITFI